MNEGGDSENAGDGGVDDDAVGESEDREPSGEGDAPDDSWSASAPTESDEEIPLPWTVVDAEELDDAVPDEFEALRFVGPKTADALRDSNVDVEDIVRKRVSYRDLTERGVHPGVAAKIRREHSLSWSFDSADSDLSRRSSQVRGLDDEERAWVAASSGWTDDDDNAAETDGSGDAAGGESAWRAQTGGGTAADSADDPTRDQEAAWREKSVDGETADDVRDDETAWRERATESAGEADASPVDAEAAWREQSAPTPVTVLDDVDATHAEQLSDAGIRSVRRLATADPESVADALELDQSRVERWCDAARARLD